MQAECRTKNIFFHLLFRHRPPLFVLKIPGNGLAYPPPKNQRTQKNTRAHRRAQKSQPNIADHAQRNRARNQTHQGLSPLRTESPSPPRRCFARCQTRLSRSRQDCRALESPTLQRSGLRLNPASDVIPRSINPRAIPLDDIRNLPWDELLHMLSRARIVARIRDGRAQTVHANPCLHQHVFGSLRGGMWRAWAIERIFRKAQQAVQCEIAIDFVRGNVVEVRIMMPRRPKKAHRSRPRSYERGVPNPVSSRHCETRPQDAHTHQTWT